MTSLWGNSSRFDPSVFDLTNEDAVFDRKEVLYRVDIPISRAELIKDVIALANSARQRGSPAYLIFGVKDDRSLVKDEEGKAVGIQGQFIREKAPDNWYGLSLNPQQQVEKVGTPLIKLLGEYIGDPGFEYECGLVQGALISYIKIPGRIPQRWYDKPFEAMKPIVDKDGKVLIQPGDCWIRRGESNSKIEYKDRDLLSCYHNVPFISAREWRVYLNQMTVLGEDFAPLPLFCTVTNTSEHILLEEFLLDRCATMSDRSEDKAQRILVINQPGCGKTTALQRLTRILAQQALLALESNPSEPPNTPIPVFVSLRTYSFKQEGRLIDYCIKSIESKGVDFRAKEAPEEKIFADKLLSFIIILDGFDEMVRGSWEANRHDFDAFMSGIHYHTIITSCRSTRVREIPTPEGLSIHKFFQQARVEPLEKAHIEPLLWDITQDSQIINLLVTDMFEITSRPYGLEAVQQFLLQLEELRRVHEQNVYEYESSLFDYGASSSNELMDSSYDHPGEFHEPTLFAVLDFVVPFILQREIRKQSIPNSSDMTLAEQRIIESLSELAWRQVKGRRHSRSQVSSPKLPRSQEIQEWLTWTGLLEVNEASLRFTSLLIRDYFAVQYLRSLDDVEKAQQLAKTTPERVQQMLQQATQEQNNG